MLISKVWKRVRHTQMNDDNVMEETHISACVTSVRANFAVLYFSWMKEDACFLMSLRNMLFFVGDSSPCILPLRTMLTT